MNKFAAIIVALILPFSVFALTPKERERVKQAQGFVQEAMVEFDQARAESKSADDRAAEAIKRATESEAHSSETDVLLENLQKEIKKAHDHEQQLADKVKPLQDFWDKAHDHWGLGAFVLGFQILRHNLLVLLGVIIVVMLVLFGLSLAFPAVGAVLAIAGGFIKTGTPIVGRFFVSVFRTVVSLIAKKKTDEKQE
jgi:preprotein translocase subunit SecF